MLALIAGQGRLPTLLAERAEPGRVLSLDGFPPDAVLPDVTFRIEQLGTLIADLVTDGVDRIVMAGAIGRPALDPGKIDAATLPLVPNMMGALQSGDDAALRVVLGFFDDAGIKAVGAHQILPELLPAEGVLTRKHPDDQARSDLSRGRDILATMGAADVGQGVVVKGGQALVIEGSFGTDWMLSTLAARPDGTGGVFVKSPKPGQDRRVDMPTIGPATISMAAEVGLDGISIEAGGVYVLDIEDCVALADQKGLFLDVA